jgi:hypothetical protein
MEEANVTKKVYLFGPRSLAQAQRHAQKHRGENLVILKAPDRRIAVCRATTALALRAKGFTAIDVGK